MILFITTAVNTSNPTRDVDLRDSLREMLILVLLHGFKSKPNYIHITSSILKELGS
jgi:hypothetical protein